MLVKCFNIRIDVDNVVADQREVNQFMELHTVTNTATQFVNGSPDFWSILVFYDEPKQEVDETTIMATHTNWIDALTYALKAWRKDKANEKALPLASIMSDTTISEIARSKPRTTRHLYQIQRLTDHQCKVHGDDILAICNAF